MATPAEILEVPQAEFDVVPEGARVHALEILDDLEHPHVAVARDEGFELGGDGVELFRRHAAVEHDLDRLGVVVFLVGEHAAFLSACGTWLFHAGRGSAMTVHGKLNLTDR